MRPTGWVRGEGRNAAARRSGCAHRPPPVPHRCDVYSPDEGTMAMSNHGVPAEEGAPGFPALPEGKRVGVLMIHGGAWMLGEKEQLEMWARGMAKKG